MSDVAYRVLVIRSMEYFYDLVGRRIGATLEADCEGDSHYEDGSESDGEYGHASIRSTGNPLRDIDLLVDEAAKACHCFMGAHDKDEIVFLGQRMKWKRWKKLVTSPPQINERTVQL